MSTMLLKTLAYHWLKRFSIHKALLQMDFKWMTLFSWAMIFSTQFINLTFYLECLQINILTYNLFIILLNFSLNKGVVPNTSSSYLFAGNIKKIFVKNSLKINCESDIYFLWETIWNNSYNLSFAEN